MTDTYSDEQFRQAVGDFMSPEQLGMMSWLYSSVRAGDTATVTPTLAALLGREPITLEQFASDYADVWR